MQHIRLLAPALLLGAVACSGPGFSQPTLSAFTPGSCQTLAPSVLALGRDLHSLGTRSPSDSRSDALKSDQAQLRSRQAGLSTELAPTVQQLVTAVGIVRLRADTDSYDPSLARRALGAYREVLSACGAS